MFEKISGAAKSVASSPVGGSMVGSALGSAGGLYGTLGGGILGQQSGSVNGLFDRLSGMDPTNPNKFQAAQYDINPAAFTDQTRSNDLRNQFGTQLANANARTANFDMSGQDQMRGAQAGLLSQLQAQSMGQGPSLAQNQLQQGTEAGIRAAMAQGTGHPGMNPALAQRNIMNQMAGANQAQALNAANLRTQEQMNAQSALGGLALNIRSQDIGAQTNRANAQLQQQQLNDAQSRFFNTGIAEQNQQDRAAQMALEKLRADQTAGTNATNAESFANTNAQRNNFMGNLGGGIAGIAAMASDEELKQKMRDAGPDIEKTLNAFSLPIRSAKKLAVGDSSGLGKGLASAGKSVGKRSPGESEPEAVSANTDVNTYGVDMIANCGGMVPHKYAHGGDVDGLEAGLMDNGGKVPGEAEVDGDSEKNDKIKALLSPGEIVLPRSVASEAIENPDSSKLRSFLDALKPTKYEYKDEKWGKGDHISPMAQELEQSDLGKQMVVDTPQGKMVDYGKGFGYMLAAQAHNHQRLGDLENAFKKMYGGGSVSFADAKEDDNYKKHTSNIKDAFSIVPKDNASDSPERSQTLWDKIKSVWE